MGKGIHQNIVVRTDEAGLREIEAALPNLDTYTGGDFARVNVPPLIEEIRRLRDLLSEKGSS